MTGDTSAATALAARYAAIIWERYPQFWPETVRGLLVHSSRWTDKMFKEFPHRRRETRLRCYGYGVPDLQQALSSASNAATLIVEETLQPFEKPKRSPVKTKDMHIHNLPWPTEVLEGLGEVEVKMRVTLSYFIEPGPGCRGWDNKFRYMSHGLRFDVKRPGDSDIDVFIKRISAAERGEDENVPGGEDGRTWEIGPNLRKKGSIHSDTWTGPAIDLARCGVLAVFPVGGWWKERAHLKCFDRKARYSLIVTIETPGTDVYTSISNQIHVPTEITM